MPSTHEMLIELRELKRKSDSLIVFIALAQNQNLNSQWAFHIELDGDLESKGIYVLAWFI